MEALASPECNDVNIEINMPIHITDINDGLGNEIVMSGFITESEFVDSFQRHLNQEPEKFKKYRFSLTDLSDVIGVDLSSDAIREHSRACICAAGVNPDAVVAVVAPKDLGYGLSRMWEILSSEEIAWETNVFRDKKEAILWIKERAIEKWNLTDITSIWPPVVKEKIPLTE